ncbi:unnamed protein product [Brachionus calyciflorus]|uniref:Leucine-rich repeat-containing protein 14 n=1 Tax=Brachionus calyciflorus TaxID=104777 RepID=A0A813ML47_9BILA|nr:unnamed protein product [Brachionus calyciflorus]
MADFTFLFNRKGALYPLDFKTETTQSKLKNRFKNDWPLNNLLDSTLVHLCSKVLVNLPAKQLDRILDIIPAELFVPLFKASLYPVRDNALDIIINKWPYKSLKMSKFLSNMFSSLVVLYSDAEMGHRTRLGVKYSADVVHSFIDALRNRKTKLRYLDVTGLPIAEIIIKYVATHCRLAQKEYQRNCLIDEYLQNVTDLETLCDKSKNEEENSNVNKSAQISNLRSDLKKTTSLPDEQLIFKFDCILQERATFDELMGALEANAGNNRFCMQICKLDLLCLGKSNIIKLLDKLDKELIEGLRLQYNSITEESIRDIIPYLSQLRNLRALDLSCNLIDYRQNSEVSRQMADVLGSLKHLNRLDLSGSPLGGCLSSLLSGIDMPLQYLSLHSCGLTDTDLFYLSNSKHVLVEHLDLSENRLTRFSDSLILLLKKCAPNLNVLELDDNRFDCIDYLTIICVARKMPKLKLLATKGTFEVNDHLLGAEFLQHSNSLLAWRISLPIDVYDPNETDIVAQEAQKRVFVERINAIIKDKFKLVVNELFF